MGDKDVVCFEGRRIGSRLSRPQPLRSDDLLCEGWPPIGRGLGKQTKGQLYADLSKVALLEQPTLMGMRPTIVSGLPFSLASAATAASR